MDLVRILNPDTEDFTVKYHKKSYTIEALGTAEFPEHIAEHIKKHLADKLLEKKGARTNPVDDLKEISEEIGMED